MTAALAAPFIKDAFDKPKKPALPATPPPPPPEAVAEQTQSASKNARKKFGSRFGRRSTLLAANSILPLNPNKKGLLGL